MSVVPPGENHRVQVAVVPGPDGGGWLGELDDGVMERRWVDDLVAAIAERERADRPRWVWASTTEIYSRLLGAGVTVERCHDLEMVEGLLLGYDGRWGAPRSVRAAWARLREEPEPPDEHVEVADDQPALFAAAGPGRWPEGADPLEVIAAIHADQQRRAADTEQPGRTRLLHAAESASALAAVEMTGSGVPWRADIHDGILTEMLGPRPPRGLPPKRLADLAERIGAAFGQRLNPDSPADVLRAFRRVGVELETTRAWVLRKIDHPAVPLLLEYKELSRLHTAHGWAWLRSWVRDGRFRPEWVPGGVVSGRWASRGGGALQIPKLLRKAVVADPGWALVVADAAQLEPRVLAALSGDAGLAAASRQGDLYEALAAEAFDGDRAMAKVGMLGALYGQTSGEGAATVARLRQRFGPAVDYVERAAHAGEEGRLVRSVLGRTCPPPSRRELTGAYARARGRFTRNFVVQASAADWTAALLAVLRQRLGAAELVFFQHDEVMVHCPAEVAPAVSEAVVDAADEASRLVFGATDVRFPLEVATVESYADAK